MPERLFRVIVGRRHTGAPEEGKEKFLFGPCEIATEGLSGFETKRLFADGVEFPNEALLDFSCLVPVNGVGLEKLRYR